MITEGRLPFFNFVDGNRKGGYRLDPQLAHAAFGRGRIQHVISAQYEQTMLQVDDRMEQIVLHRLSVVRKEYQDQVGMLQCVKRQIRESPAAADAAERINTPDLADQFIFKLV